jgi:hypothetical protein
MSAGERDFTDITWRLRSWRAGVKQALNDLVAVVLSQAG